MKRTPEERAAMKRPTTARHGHGKGNPMKGKNCNQRRNLKFAFAGFREVGSVWAVNWN